MNQCEQVATNAACLRGDNAKGGVRGDGGVDGVPSAAENRNGGRSGEMVWGYGNCGSRGVERGPVEPEREIHVAIAGRRLLSASSTAFTAASSWFPLERADPTTSSSPCLPA